MEHGVRIESVLFPSQQLFVRTSSFTQDLRYSFLFVFHFQIVRFDTHWYTFEFSSIKLALACIRCESAIFFHLNCFHVLFHIKLIGVAQFALSFALCTARNLTLIITFISVCHFLHLYYINDERCKKNHFHFSPFFLIIISNLILEMWLR